MTTEEDISNNALGMAHQDATITSMTEDSVEARRCNLIYDQCRKVMLQIFPFGFSTKVIQLNKIDKTVKSGFIYAYQYPPVALQIQSLRITGETEFLALDRVPYEVYTSDDYLEKEIHSNVELLSCIATLDLKKTGLFSALFSELLAAYMSVKLSRIVALDRADRTDIYNAYRIIKLEAEEASALESFYPFDQKNQYVEDRGN